MRVLVAGGAGFIGSHLCEQLLKEGHEVICADNFSTASWENLQSLKNNKNFHLLKHDIVEPLPSTLSVDCVFHLASPASPNHHSKISYHALPLETILANTKGTLELLTFSQKNKAQFLFASSSEVYGDPLAHPQREDYFGNVSTTGPRSVYDESKRLGETLTAYFWRDRDLNARIARIFNTYGPRLAREDMRMVITFINQALSESPITVFGDGTQTRSLCYIDDMIEGLTTLMFHANTKGEVVNLGSEDEHTVLEYAQMIKKLTNSKSKIVFSEQLPQDDPKKRCPDISKAKKLLGWKPKISLAEGLKRMIAYVKESAY
ncbi:SDR family oxidoreductase [Candidatus Roizmanbacteria bacterium]|nr:SDR family oxidoreductase [Candidatus Roizmanbacteria bacterium]